MSYDYSETRWKMCTAVLCLVRHGEVDESMACEKLAGHSGDHSASRSYYIWRENEPAKT